MRQVCRSHRGGALWLALLLHLAVGARAEPLPAPLREWMRCEQGCLSRTVDTSRLKSPTINHQDRRYAPETGATFPIKSYWVDADKMTTFPGIGLPRELRGELLRRKDGRRQIRLLVHPESEGLYAGVLRGADRGADLMASATASSRTLLVWPQGQPGRAFFAKVSLDKEIGGSRRTVSQGEVARSVGVNNVLQLASRRAELPGSFGFVPEVFSTIPRGMEEGGMIIRAIPRQVLEGERRLVPLFSLYAQPSGGGRPMLEQMIERSGQPAETYIRDRIIRPFARQYVELSIKQGIIPEPHAQNVLIELDRQGQPTGRFVHRDFGGFNLDFDYRRRSGKAMPARMPSITTFEGDYKIGRYGTPTELVGRNLDTFFYGGFVYNLDREVPRWSVGAGLREGTFKSMLATELEQQLSAHTGRTVRLRDNLSSVSRAVPEVRGERPRGLRGLLYRLGFRGRN